MLAEQELSIKLVKKILSADNFYKTFFSGGWGSIEEDGDVSPNLKEVQVSW